MQPMPRNQENHLSGFAVRGCLIAKYSLLLLFLNLQAANTAWGSDLPPPNVLKAIVRQLRSASARTVLEFIPQASSPVSDQCAMQAFEMRLTRNDKPIRSYSVLLDPQAGSVVPRQFFAVLRRLTVDGDGSSRAYHPEDPEGTGNCRRVLGSDGQASLQGICPIERFEDSGTFVFRGPERLADKALALGWKAMWPLIRDRRLKSIDMRDIAGIDAPTGSYLFYWDDRQLTSIFQDDIIPKDFTGYPCIRGSESPYPGYFVAATALHHDAAVRPDGCAPSSYVDGDTIPFFVLPKGTFGIIEVGDVMVASIRRSGVARMVYGIVGDIGPANRLGEGSLALNAALLGKAGPFASRRESWKLDIDGEDVAVLVLGGTRAQLKDNYSRSNVEAVARGEIARWSKGNSMQRFEACRAVAAVNKR
jgi:hypothetical protein